MTIMSKDKIQEYNPPFVAQHDLELGYCIITDIDGTISYPNNRSYYDADKYDSDIPSYINLSVIIGTLQHISQTLQKKDLPPPKLIVLTGRMDGKVAREKTTKWLETMLHSIHFELIMRSPGDYRKDYEVKYELIKEVQQNYNILYAFDYRNSSCKAYRDLGVPCFQVDEDNSQKECKDCKEWKGLFHSVKELTGNEMLYCPTCGRKF